MSFMFKYSSFIKHCKDKKLIGDFYSTPNQDILKGNFNVDKELNYVLVANSAMVISKISKLITKPLSRAPDVKIKGNLYNFFYIYRKSIDMRDNYCFGFFINF